MCGQWFTMPGDINEAGKIRIFRAADILAEDTQGDFWWTDSGAPARGVEPEPEHDVVGGPAEQPRPEFALLGWNESNHESMLFSNINHTVSFLSLDPAKLRKKMHPNLLRNLEQNRINVGEGLQELNDRYFEILSALTNVVHTRKDAGELMGGKYSMTGDSLLKMLAIYVRIRCGIPVVLCGECGCGKTYLINYVCAWLGVELVTLDVHGGTQESDILEIFSLAETKLSSSMKEVIVFLDELNTCPHMGLMVECICHRSLNGRPLPEGLKVLAALNPYRRRALKQQQSPGLVFQLGERQSTPDPMASLVYRVHPVPQSLQDFIFDFGSLTPEQEALYILAMVRRSLPEWPDAHQAVTDLICASQEYVRHIEGDASACSLRDVKRCLNLIKWFDTLLPKQTEAVKKTNQQQQARAAKSFCTTTVLGIAHVYYYRIDDTDKRWNYWQKLSTTVSCMSRRSQAAAGMLEFENAADFTNILELTQKWLCAKFVVEDGIAMNEALMENLFVVVVCVLNRIPVFVVGKPGSSKTLTLSVLASNLVGEQSSKPFWRRFPSINVVQYQCSP